MITTLSEQVKDPGAPVDFYFKGEKISKNDSRCVYSKLEDGKHQLSVHGLKMEDLGMVEARGVIHKIYSR